MILTKSEKEYLADYIAEFGSLRGSNSYSSNTPFLSRGFTPITKKATTRPLSIVMPDEKLHILFLRAKGIPYAEIEKEFNITSQTIWRIQREAGFGQDFGKLISECPQ